MKKWFKRVVIAVALLAIVAVVGVAIFLLTFDPNAYKYKLADMVQQRYDRTLTIEGEMELSLFPRIGLNVQGVSLSEPGRPQDIFASVDSARVAVAVWPLLFNRLVVDHVAIDSFKARIVRDKNGEFNFQDLVGRAPRLPQARAGMDGGRAAAGAAGGWACRPVPGRFSMRGRRPAARRCRSTSPGWTCATARSSCRTRAPAWPCGCPSSMPRPAG